MGQSAEPKQAIRSGALEKKRQGKRIDKRTGGTRGFGKKITKEPKDWAGFNIPDYDKWTIFSLTQFFYSVDPDGAPVEVFEALIDFLKNKNIEFRVDDDNLALDYTYKVNMKVEEDGDGDE